MRKIIFVSRLDADCSLGASILCDISLKLHKKYPDLQILIIGGGEKYPEFRTRANKINEIINCKLIRVTGNVDSPSEYFEKNSLFVGVSRASLEAMAHGLPVVLLGNEGFLGLLDQTNLKKAEKTNFTCRKYRLCSNTQELRALLFDEICRYFELPEEKKQELSDFSYQIAKNKYSSQKTAEKTVEFYREVLNNYHKNSAFYPH